MKSVILFFLLAFMATCCISQPNQITNHDFQQKLTQTELNIFNGNIDEYWRYSNRYFGEDEADSLQRNFIFYSYIMAVQYNYRPAAYDCFTLLGGLDDYPMDSALTQVLLNLLEIGASGDTSCSEISEITCAIKLSEWYSGKKYVKSDPSKSEYYMEKARAMARSRKRRNSHE